MHTPPLTLRKTRRLSCPQLEPMYRTRVKGIWRREENVSIN